VPAPRPTARHAPWAAAAALALVLTSVSAPEPADAVAVPSTYANPVFGRDFADPFVLRDGPIYYAYATSTLFSNVQVLKSRDLASWVSVTNEALPARPGWADWPDLWAPAVARQGATWVLYYAVRERSSGLMCLSRALGAHPAGPFRDVTSGPMVCHRRLGGTIDPQPFVDSDGTAWLLYKTEGVPGREPSRIWAQRLRPDGLAVVGDAVPLLAADHAWEAGVVEAPAMVRRGRTYHLFYSGNAWHTDAYAVGHAVCTGVRGPCRKTASGPVLRSGNGVAGPGGQDLFTDDRGHAWIAYHAWHADAVGYPHGTRSLRIDPVRFWGDTPLVFGPTVGPRPLHGVPDHPAAALVVDPSGHGYGVVTRDGDVFVHGARRFAGSAADAGEWNPFTAAMPTPSGQGYWLVTAAGRVVSLGDALHHGDLAGQPLAHPITAAAATPSGLGYVLVDGTGVVRAFGDASHHGDLRAVANPHPVVGVAAGPGGQGYRLVDTAGRVFAFGAAAHAGDLRGRYLHQPVVAIEPSPTGGGYWLVDRVGHVRAFGDAAHHGDLRAVAIPYPVVDLVAGPGGTGYWMLTNDGRVFPFGTARQHGWTPLPGS